MYNLPPRNYSWEELISIVLNHPPHVELIVEDWMVPPIPKYFKWRLGDLQGQIADYGVGLSDKRGIHVKRYKNGYTIHWDRKDPSQDPLGHLVQDAPHWLATIIGGAAIGIGYGVYRYYNRKDKKRKR